MAGPYVYPFYARENGPARPYIPICFTNPMTGRQFNWYALIDSGADQSIFPSDLTEVLGHNLKGRDVESSITFGIEGRMIKTWLHTFVLELRHPRDPRRVVRSFEPRRYECSDRGHFPPILGQSDFLCHFVLTLDYPRQTSSLRW